MFTHLSTDQVDTVRRSGRSIQGSFTYLHIDGMNGSLEEIAIEAIHEETAPVFAAIRESVAALGYASCGHLAEALNAIVRTDVEAQAQADRAAIPEPQERPLACPESLHLLQSQAHRFRQHRAWLRPGMRPPDGCRRLVPLFKSLN